jgi:hypothetical protein
MSHFDVTVADKELKKERKDAKSSQRRGSIEYSGRTHISGRIEERFFHLECSLFQ